MNLYKDTFKVGDNVRVIEGTGVLATYEDKIGRVTVIHSDSACDITFGDERGSVNCAYRFGDVIEHSEDAVDINSKMIGGIKYR